MKYMVIGILIFGSIVLGWILKNIVWPAIKADPVSNLIMPVATALLTNLLLLWLEMQRLAGQTVKRQQSSQRSLAVEQSRQSEMAGGIFIPIFKKERI